MVEELLCCCCSRCLSGNCLGKCTCNIPSCKGNCFSHLCAGFCKNPSSNCSGSEFNLLNCLCHCSFFEGGCCMKIEEDCLTAFKFTENISSCSSWFQGICGNISNSLSNCFSSIRCCFPETCLLTLGYNYNFGNTVFEVDDDEEDEDDEEEEEKKKKEENKRKNCEEDRLNDENKQTRRDDEDDNDVRDQEDNGEDIDDDYHCDVDKEQIIIQVGDYKIDDDATKQNDNFVIEDEDENKDESDSI